MRAKKVFIVTLLLIASLGMSSSQQAMASITYSFTTAGASGRTGPIQSQVTTAYTGTTLAGVVSVNTQGIQEWTVPFSGQYSITAVGAKGGGSNGGKGARIYGEFSLTQGTVLKILVGQRGSASFNTSAGGGGGSFVWKASDTSTPLIAAGGGGGQGGAGRAAVDASITTAGTAGTTGATSNIAGAGGTNGNPGTTADNPSNSWSAAAGAGWKGNSTRALNYSGDNSNIAYSPLNGGMGGLKFANPIGALDCGDNSGGFGGGGGGGGSATASPNSCGGMGELGVGGGGGGYSGGGNGSNDSSSNRGAGGGGGSLNGGTNQSATSGFNSLDGYVTIVYIVDPVATSVTLAIAGNVTAVSKSTTIAITATVGAPGKITFSANGKRIPGCISKPVTNSIVCNWRPASRGAYSLTATLTPSDLSSYLISNSVNFNLASNPRGNRR